MHLTYRLYKWIYDTFMTILIIGWITFPFGSASGSRIRTLSTGLVENGHGVHVLTTHRLLHRNDDLQTDGTLAYKGITYEGTNVPEVPGNKLSLPERIRNHIMAIIKSWFRFAEIARNKKCSSVYIYGRSFVSYGPICLLARLYGIKIIFDICEWFPANRYKGRYLNPSFINDFLGRQLPRFCRGKVVAITSYIKTKYEAYGVPCILIPSVYDFRNQSDSAPITNHESRSDEFNVVYAGTCKSSDGVAILFDAIRIAAKEGCPVRLKMVGSDGKSRTSLKFGKICQQDEILKNHITFCGRLSEADYAKTLSTADCLALPRPDTQTNRAAFPTRLPEFLATGRPVLTSDTPDIPLYVEAGKHAEIVPAKGGAPALAQGILTLWKNPDYASQIGEQGQLRCKEVFDSHAHLTQLSCLICPSTQTN